MVHLLPVVVRMFFLSFRFPERWEGKCSQTTTSVLADSDGFVCHVVGPCGSVVVVVIIIDCFNLEDFTYLIVKRSGYEQRPSVGLLFSVFCSVVWVSFFVVFVFVVVLSFIFVVGQ